MRQAPITALNAFDADTSFMDVRGMKSPFVHLSSNDWLPEADYARFGPDLVISNDGGEKIVLVGYFENPVDMAVKGANGVIIPAHIVDILAGPEAPMQFAQAGGGALGEPIGQVETLNGTVTVVRATGEKVTLKQGDSLYQGDELVTGADGAVGVTFADESTMSLDADGRLVLDELVYDAGAAEGGGSMMLLKGAMTFVSGQIAKTDPDAMNIKTPVATIGIRGTAGGVVAGEGGETSVVLLSEAGQGGGILTGEITVATSGGVVTVNGGFQGLSITDGTLAPPPPQTMSLNEFGTVFGGAFGMIANPGAFPADVTNAVDKIVARIDAARLAQQAQQEADTAQQEADAARLAAENASPEDKAAADQRAAEAQAKADVARANAAKAETELNNATQEADQAVNQAANTLGNDSLAGNTNLTGGVVSQNGQGQSVEGQGAQGQNNTPTGTQGNNGNTNLEGNSEKDNLFADVGLKNGGDQNGREDGSKDKTIVTKEPPPDDPSPPPPNKPPVVVNAIPDQTGEEGAAFNLTLPADTFSDPDGDSLTYSATFADGAPLSSQGITFDLNDQNEWTFSGTLAAGSAGTHSIKVTVTDGRGGSVSDIFNFTVSENYTETQINTETAGSQQNTSVAALSDGGWIVAWESLGHDNADAGWGVYAQMYNADGSANGSEFLVNTETADAQRNPHVVELTDGDFMIAWDSYSQGSDVYSGIYAQRYNPDGSVDGAEKHLNSSTGGNEANPNLIAMPGGGYALVSRHEGGNSVEYSDQFLQIFDSADTEILSETLINTYTTQHQNPASAVATADGKIITVWESDQQDTSSTKGIFAKVFDPSGPTWGAEFQVNDPSSYNQYAPSAAALANGNVVVAWSDYDTSSQGVNAKIFDSSGTEVVGQFLVNSTATNAQSTPSVATLSGDNFVVVWQGQGDDGGTSYGIYGQIFNASGGKIGAEFQINTETAGDQTAPQVAVLADGDFIVTWASDGQDGDGLGIYMQRFNADGTTNGTAITVNNTAPDFSSGATLAAALENDANPVGDTVASLFGSQFTDTDSDAMAGIAITADASNGAEGSWEYSTDSGTTWHSIGTVSTDAALMLDTTAKLRFVPVASYSGTPGALTVHAIDDSVTNGFSYGATRALFDTTTDDATSSVSAAGSSLSTSVTGVNDAPSFSAGGNYAAIAEDSTSPTSFDVQTLIGAQFTDIDGDAMAGVAIAGDASTASEGTWQYSTDAGTTWYDIGTVSTSSALLLDNSSHIRFIPTADYNGTVGSLTLHAVDDSTALTFTSGTTKQTFDTTTDDATSPVSASGISYGIEGINAVNDAPTLSGDYATTSFSAGQSIGATEIYNYVETGDFNNDGNLDLALADGTASDVTIRLGDGAGGFGAEYTVVSGAYGRLRVADLNGDNYDDIVTGAGDVYLNNQDNSFTSSFNFGTINRQTALGDADGDGDLDLLVLNQSIAPKLYLNDGSGGFTLGQTFTQQQTTFNDTAVAFADFDGDGDQDIVLGGWGQDAEVWENDGTGTYSFNGYLNNKYDSGGGTDTGTASTLDIEAADFDGDGDIDLYLNNRYGQSFVFKNDGDGNLTFTKDAGYGGTDAGPLAGTNGRENSAIGDLDGDGDLDIVAAHWDGADEYLINDGTGVFTNINSTNAITTYTNDTYQSAVGDFNGDGLADVFKASYTADHSEVILNTSNEVDYCYLTDVAVSPFASMVIADGDSTNIASANLTITGFAAGDVLSVGMPGSLSVNYNTSTGVMNITGVDSIANYQTAIQSITFTSTTDATESRTISLTVSDDSGGISDPLTAKVNLVNTDPIVIDLDGDGIETVSASEGVRFDIDGDGVKEQTGWVAPDDGLLAADLNDNGSIDDVGELVSPSFNYENANPGDLTSSADVMALYDENKDGLISSEDEIYDKLVIWQDANSNGISEAGELTSLADAGIESLQLSFVKAGKSQDGATLTKLGETNGTDGSTGQWGEVAFDSYTVAPNQDDETGVTVAAE